MRKFASILLFLIVVVLNSTMAFNDNVVKGKLLKKLGQLQHDTTRLEVLQELIELTSELPDERNLYVDKLYNEAQQQQHVKYICISYLYRIEIAGDNNDVALAEKWYNTLQQTASKHKLNDILYYGQLEFALAKYSKSTQRLESEYKKVLRDATATGNIAAISQSDYHLANLYRSVGRTQEAIDHYEAAYINANKAGRVSLTSKINDALVVLYSAADNDIKWLSTIKREESLLDSLANTPNTNKHQINNLLIQSYIDHVYYYLHSGNANGAEKYVVILNEIFQSNPDVSSYAYHRACIGYYNSIGEYEKSLEEVEKLSKLVCSSSDNYSEVLYLKANILNNLGNDKGAVDNYKMAFMSQDTALKINHQTNIYNMRKATGIADLDTKARSIVERRHLLRLSVVGVILILVALTIAKVVKTNRKIKHMTRETLLLNAKTTQTLSITERFIVDITSITRPPIMIIYEKTHRAFSGISDVESPSELGREIGVIADNVTKLIGEIVDMSRLDTGTMKFQTSNVDLSIMVRDAISMVAQRGIAISYKAPEIRLCLTKIDGARFFQVLRNLLSKIDEGSDQISVIMEAKNDHKVTITVYGAALASQSQSMEHTLNNEINTRFVSYFGGQYEVASEVAPPFIRITLPASRIETLI